LRQPADGPEYPHGKLGQDLQQVARLKPGQLNHDWDLAMTTDFRDVLPRSLSGTWALRIRQPSFRDLPLTLNGFAGSLPDANMVLRFQGFSP
jgi:hypothetical protein